MWSPDITQYALIRNIILVQQFFQAVLSDKFIWNPSINIRPKLNFFSFCPSQDLPILIPENVKLLSPVHLSWPLGKQHVRLFCPPLSWSLLRFVSSEFMMPSNHLILSYPLLVLPSVFPSQHQGLFQWVSPAPHVAKVLELQLQHQSVQWVLRISFL